MSETSQISDDVGWLMIINIMIWMLDKKQYCAFFGLYVTTGVASPSSSHSGVTELSIFVTRLHSLIVSTVNSRIPGLLHRVSSLNAFEMHGP